MKYTNAADPRLFGHVSGRFSDPFFAFVFKPLFVPNSISSRAASFCRRATLKTPLVGSPQSADKKFVRARGPQNWNPGVFDQTMCSRTLEHRIRPE